MVVASRQTLDERYRLRKFLIGGVVSKAHDLAIKVAMGTGRIGNHRIRTLLLVNVRVGDINVIAPFTLQQVRMQSHPQQSVLSSRRRNLVNGDRGGSLSSL